MLAVLLALAGAKVYDAGSVVTLDTTSAVVPMSELRRAVDIMQDHSLILGEIDLQNQRHQADSAALQHCQAGCAALGKALDSLGVAEAATDRARKAAVDSAGAIAKAAQHQFRAGLCVGGGIGAVAVLLVLLLHL